MAQVIVVVQVLIAKRNAMDALREQCFDAMLDPVLPPAICEAGRRLAGQTDGAIGFAQQQRALRSRSSRRRRTPAVTLRLPRLAKSRDPGYTLSASARPPASGKSFVAKELSLISPPMRLFLVRYAG